MRSLMTITFLLFASVSVCAQGPKPCEELKAEIAKKLEAKNVKSYSLQIVPSEKANDLEGKVVGSCEGGTKKIVHRKTPPAPETRETEPSKP